MRYYTWILLSSQSLNTNNHNRLLLGIFLYFSCILKEAVYIQLILFSPIFHSLFKVIDLSRSLILNNIILTLFTLCVCTLINVCYFDNSSDNKSRVIKRRLYRYESRSPITIGEWNKVAAAASWILIYRRRARETCVSSGSFAKVSHSIAGDN